MAGSQQAERPTEATDGGAPGEAPGACPTNLKWRNKPKTVESERRYRVTVSLL
jgi:hypothetical protein